MKILLLENISNKAGIYLRKQGYEVIIKNKSLSNDELINIVNIYNIDFIGIRSKTKVTCEVLYKCNRLLGIGCFCIGTDQVDLQVARELGIAVFNSPFASTRSVAELTICHIIALSRQLGIKNMEMHSKFWNKTATNMYEIRGKKLGIIGYGHVGSQLAILAENMGMDVYYYDIKNVMPLGNSKCCNSMDELLQLVNFVSLHVPLDETTKEMIGEKEINLMPKNSYLINLSRGAVLDINAVKKGLENGHLAGVAVDVFPIEPSGNKVAWNNILQNNSNNMYNIILTPHIGGATHEAQDSIGIDVAQKLIKYNTIGDTEECVNLPQIIANGTSKYIKICCIHINKSGVLSKINAIFNNHNINIIKQYLSTMDAVGYCITEINNCIGIETLNVLKTEIEYLKENIRTFIH